MTFFPILFLYVCFETLNWCCLRLQNGVIFFVNVMSYYFLSLSSSSSSCIFRRIKYCLDINRTRNQAQHYHFVVLSARYVIILAIFFCVFCRLFFSRFFPLSGFFFSFGSKHLIALLIQMLPMSAQWHLHNKMISKHIIVKMICKWNICSY